MSERKAPGKTALPRFLVKSARRLYSQIMRKTGFYGEYVSWPEALLAAGNPDGYEAPHIIQKTVEKTQAIQAKLSSGNRLCKGRTLHLLAALWLPFDERPDKTRFDLLDFGGQMGVHYYHVRGFFPESVHVHWHICETPATARAGRQHFEDKNLSFISGIDEVSAHHRYDAIHVSGSLQYVEKPEDAFRALARLNCRWLIFDRLPLTSWQEDRLTVQRVDPSKYVGNYPAWFFSESKWFDIFSHHGYELSMRWPSPQDTAHVSGDTIVYSGLLLKKTVSSAGSGA